MTTPSDTPTGEICPACVTCPACSQREGEVGTGFVMTKDDATAHAGVMCTVCDGNGWCATDAPALREWYARNGRDLGNGDGFVKTKGEGHVACSVCDGEGWCPADSAKLRDWLARHGRN